MMIVSTIVSKEIAKYLNNHHKLTIMINLLRYTYPDRSLTKEITAVVLIVHHKKQNYLILNLKQLNPLRICT